MAKKEEYWKDSSHDGTLKDILKDIGDNHYNNYSEVHKDEKEDIRNDSKRLLLHYKEEKMIHAIRERIKNNCLLLL